MGTPFMVISSTVESGFLQCMERCSLFSALNSIRYIVAQSEAASKSKVSFVRAFLDFLPILKAVVSPAKIAQSHESDCGRSSMKSKNRSGPNTVPCGIPDLTASHGEKQPLA